MTEKLFIGVDGGGTKTEAVVVNESGDVLASLWRNQSAMFPIVGREVACKLLFEMFVTLCKDSSVFFSHVERVAICLAGAGRKEDQLAMKRDLEEFARLKNISHPEIIIDSDAIAALFAAFGNSGEGVILIAGTGSVALARNARGQIFRAGGWGRTMGDEGSGHWLGTKALACYAQSLDGRRRDISATFIHSIDERLGALQLTDRRSLISKIYSQEIIPASFAPEIINAAHRSEAFALDILEEGAAEIFSAVRAVTEKAGIKMPARVALFGGLVSESGPAVYRSAVESKIISSGKFFLVTSPPSPVIGASILAQHPTGHVVASDQEW